MFESEITAANHHLCQIECRIDATPETIIEVWRDPTLFDSHVAAAPDADVVLRRGPDEKVPSSILLGNANAIVIEHLPLRIAYETIPDLALMVLQEECAADALTVCLTLTVATEPNLAGQGQDTTPCALTLSPPPWHHRLEIVGALKSLARTLSERVKARLERSREANRLLVRAERQRRIAEARAFKARCRCCEFEVDVFGYEGDVAAAHRCRQCLDRQAVESSSS